MQGAYDQVIEAYGQKAVAVNSPQVMADHIGAELNFALFRKKRFAWVMRIPVKVPGNFGEITWSGGSPQFTTDLENGAGCRFYTALALDTRNFLERGYT